MREVSDPAVLATPPRTRAGGRAQPAVDEGFSNDHSGCPNGDDSKTQAGKDPFSVDALKNRMLTYCEQSRSTAGKTADANL